MQISPDQFLRWKDDYVTVEIFKILKEYRDLIEEEMLHDGTILSPNGHDRLVRLSGMREGIDKILNIEVIIEVEDEQKHYE
jgi:hypothetical protein